MSFISVTKDVTSWVYSTAKEPLFSQNIKPLGDISENPSRPHGHCRVLSLCPTFSPLSASDRRGGACAGPASALLSEQQGRQLLVTPVCKFTAGHTPAALLSTLFHLG